MLWLLIWAMSVSQWLASNDSLQTAWVGTSLRPFYHAVIEILSLEVYRYKYKLYILLCFLLRLGVRCTAHSAIPGRLRASFGSRSISRSNSRRLMWNIHKASWLFVYSEKCTYVKERCQMNECDNFIID